jgi:mRNA interferase HigB
MQLTTCRVHWEALAFFFTGRLNMNVIVKHALTEFYTKHPDAKSPLLSWHQIMIGSHFQNPNDMRKSFPQVDIVDGLFVFNAGRAYRLNAAIHFNTQKVFIRHILTHAEYDRGKWKKR